MGLAHVGGKKTQILATAAAVSHTASPIWSSLCTQWNTSNTPCNMGRVDIYVSSNPAKQRDWEAGGPRQDVGGKAGAPDNNTEMGSYALLQRIFLTQGSNLHLLYLLNW